MTRKDLTRLSASDLLKKRDEAFLRYRREALKFDPDRDYSKPGLRFPELENAENRLNAIDDEIDRRNENGGFTEEDVRAYMDAHSTL